MNLADHLRDRGRQDALRPADVVTAAVLVQGVELAAVRPVADLLAVGDDRPTWTASSDGAHRLSANKAAGVLRWTTDTSLVARVDRAGLVPAVVVSEGRVTAPNQHAVVLDTAGRLRLGATLRAALGVRRGSQVLLVAIPGTPALAGALVLLPQTHAVAALTHALFPPRPAPQPTAEPAVPDRPTKRTNVKKVWAAPAA